MEGKCPGTGVINNQINISYSIHNKCSPSFLQTCEMTIFQISLALYIACEDGIVRLENGTSSEGRVEVCYEGYYKTVCDDFWDVLEARIVCRQLNFSVNETSKL